MIEDDRVGDSQACLAQHHYKRPELLGIVLIHLAPVRDKFKRIPKPAVPREAPIRAWEMVSRMGV